MEGGRLASGEERDRAVGEREQQRQESDPVGDVVILRYYHDLPEGEVAEILGCPPGTVKSRLHHAIARLVAAVRTGARPAARGARA